MFVLPINCGLPAAPGSSSNLLTSTNHLSNSFGIWNAFLNIFEMHLECIFGRRHLSTWILSKSILDFVPLPSCASWNGKDSQIWDMETCITAAGGESFGTPWKIRFTYFGQSKYTIHLGFLFLFGKGTHAKTLKREMMVGTLLSFWHGLFSGDMFRGCTQNRNEFFQSVEIGSNLFRCNEFFLPCNRWKTYLRSLKNPQPGDSKWPF